MRRQAWFRMSIALAFALLAAWVWWRETPAPVPPSPPVATSGAHAPDPSADNDALPAEVYAVLQRIHAGGPFPYRQDGGVFGNRERLLPQRPRGWYREYTVPTPGERDRGARRIVTGGDPPVEFFYTADHYRSFRRIESGEAWR